MKRPLIFSVFYIQKIAVIVLRTSLFFIAAQGNSQQPVLSVQTFEYVFEKTNGAMPSSDQRVIIASEDSAKRVIENAFAFALQKRWNIEMPEASLSVKPPEMFSIVPKFKTRIKEKQPGI